jgi:hypothetical protein
MKQRQYFIELGGALIVYTVLLFISLTVSRQQPNLSTVAQAAILLLPMLGAGLAVWAIVRGHRRLDELQRRVQFEALSFAFAGTAFFTFGWGFLEIAGYPRLPAFGIWPLMAALWVAGLAIARRRYR